MRNKNFELAEKAQKTKALFLSVVLHIVLFSGLAIVSGADKNAFIPDQLEQMFQKDKVEKKSKNKTS